MRRLLPILLLTACQDFEPPRGEARYGVWGADRAEVCAAVAEITEGGPERYDACCADRCDGGWVAFTTREAWDRAWRNCEVDHRACAALEWPDDVARAACANDANGNTPLVCATHAPAARR